MYRYIGKFPPQIAREVIERFAEPGSAILDPMCGGGTTLIEAKAHGLKATGYDVNPVARVVSEVVSTKYNPELVDELTNQIVDLMLRWDSSSIYYRPSQIPEPKRLNLGESASYFNDETCEKLGLILAWIDTLQDTSYQQYFYVGLLAILRKVSSANVKKINVTVDRDKKVQDVFKAYSKQLTIMKAAVLQSTPFFYDSPINISEADARKLPDADGTYDLVVIHPPYLSNTAFSESTQLQLAFMGISHKTIWKKELKMRGSYLHETDGLRKYLVGWSRILAEAYRVLKPGGVCAIENGDGQIDYVRIPIAPITVEFAKDIGYTVELCALHKMNNNTGWTLSHKMKNQYVIAMRKPE